MAPATFGGRLFCVFYALFGIPLCMLALKSIGERINELIENGFILISSKYQLQQDKGIKIKVLFSTAALVLVLLMLGGLLYLSEGWSYFDGVYYCFIGMAYVSYYRRDNELIASVFRTQRYLGTYHDKLMIKMSMIFRRMNSLAHSIINSFVH